MFIWYLINTLHYNRTERKTVEILVYLIIIYCKGQMLFAIIFYH